jgi:hypothetical protein
MMPDYASLAQAVRRWAQQSGLKVDSLTLSYRGRPVVVLPLPAGAVSDAKLPGKEEGKGLSRVVLDILKVLREAGKPLTCIRILVEFHNKGLEWSKASVESYLAAMVADGILENPPDARPRGYRLPADKSTE